MARSSWGRNPIELRGPKTLVAQNGVCEFRYRIKRSPRRLAMRRMPGVREFSYFDRTIALFPGNLDLADGPIFIIHALQDRHGNADIGEVFGNIPVTEF